MDSINPSTLTGEDFHDWIAKHLAYRQDWSTLFTREHIHRTQDSVEGLISSIETQLNDALGLGRDEWERRTKGMLVMALGRKAQIDRWFDLRDQKGWRATLHEVVALIVERGSDELVDALDNIYIPVGGLNVGEWLDVRIAKREEAIVTAIDKAQVTERMIRGEVAA